jgi:hypothetical protein
MITWKLSVLAISLSSDEEISRRGTIGSNKFGKFAKLWRFSVTFNVFKVLM